MKKSPIALVLMLIAIILGALHFTGLATWFMIQSNPELKAISMAGKIFGYLSWAINVSSSLPSPINKIILIFLICIGIAIVIGTILIAAIIKQKINYYIRG
jgi:hypothetical protein